VAACAAREESLPIAPRKWQRRAVWQPPQEARSAAALEPLPASICASGAGTATVADSPDHKLEAAIEAGVWVAAVVGVPPPQQGRSFEVHTEILHEWLKSGEVLCELIKTLQPALIGRIERSAMPFKQRENVASYLEACATLGVPQHDLFMTVDLFEGKDLGAVVRNLHSLGRVAQRLEVFDGATLGAKLSNVNRRSFSDKQMAEARAAPALLTHTGALKQWSSKKDVTSYGTPNDTHSPAKESAIVPFADQGAGAVAPNDPLAVCSSSPPPAERPPASEAPQASPGEKSSRRRDQLRGLLADVSERADEDLEDVKVTTKKWMLNEEARDDAKGKAETASPGEQQQQ